MSLVDQFKSKHEKINFIIEKVSEKNLSAYTISKNTTITHSGASRIIKGISKNPHENSLNEIIKYIEVKVLGNDPNKLSNPKLESKKVDIDEYNLCLQKLNNYMKEVAILQNILRKNNIPFKDIFDEE